MEQAILNSMDFNMIFPTRYVRRFRSTVAVWVASCVAATVAHSVQSPGLPRFCLLYGLRWLL